MVDLNASDALSARIFDRRLRPMTVRLARPAVESDFRISVSPPKTHNVVIVTLAIKNMVMGCLVNPAMAKRSSYSVETVVHPTSRIGQPAASKAAQIIQLAKMAFPGADRSDKLSMHQGYPVTNLNIARLAPKVLPHLAVIDGFEGMEGNGPNNGDQVEWHVALAGVDAVAVDHLTASLMGFDPGQIGYLVYCRQLGLGEGVLRQMEIRGGLALEEVQRKFHPHPSLARQSAWQLEDAARWLQME
jgi:uncharacterized protein (DUF362 family)